MTEGLLPALAAARTLASKTKARREDTDDQSAAINAMCKTLNATVTKLMYSFAALQSDSAMGADEAKTSIGLALAASKREELSAKVVEALSGAADRIIRCKDASMRSHVLRDLRARFAPPPEKPKPIMVDEAVQAVARKPKLSVTAAAATAHSAPAVATPPVRMAAPRPEAAGEEGPSDEELLRQLRGEALPGNGGASAGDDAAAVPAVTAPGETTTALGASKRAAAAAAAAATAAAGKHAAAIGTLLQQSACDGSHGAAAAGGRRPVTAAAATGEGVAGAGAGKGQQLPGIYERQMKWAKAAAEKKEAARVEKENRERDSEQRPAGKDGGAKGGVSARWAHVESVMRRQRIDAQESWKSELSEQMQAERERRERAEVKACEEAAARVRLQCERDDAEAKRRDAVERMDAYHERMRRAESKYEAAKAAQEQLAKQHAEALEVRDAFGERGLEEWPMFSGRRVFRVLDADEFDGRVSQEFRVRDAESGERGVSLLMGRVASGTASECQAVLFDFKMLNELEAARWYQRNAHRFEQARARVAREKQRATSAQGRSRDRPDLS